MKLSTKFLVRNLLVSSIFLGLATFFGILFWNELHRTINDVGGEIIGEVVEIRGQAQRRFSEQNQWAELGADSIIYNLDSIKTGGTSMATIVLQSYDESGEEVFDEIQLGSNTYIVFDLTASTRTVKFVGGNVSAIGSAGLAISTDNTTVYPGEGAVNLNLTEEEGISVNATDGEVMVVVNGEQSVVNPDSVLNVDEDKGRVVETRIPVKPLTPISNELLLTYNDVRDVVFSWEILANWDAPVLEIASDLSFEGDVIRRNVGNESVVIETDEGYWYWRIADDVTGETGLVSSFSVKIEQEISLITPVQNSTITYSGTSPTVLLQWKPAWFAEYYNVLIADSAAMSTLQKNLEVRGNSVLVEGLAEGQWWWQVIPVYRRGSFDSTLSRKTGNFFIEKSRGFKEIQLVLPGNRSSISAIEIQDGASFSWRDQDGIIQYELKVAADSNFNELTTVAVTQSNWHSLELDPGTYYWRVEGDSAETARATVSPTWSFEVKSGNSSIELLNPPPGENAKLSPNSYYTFHWRKELKGMSRFILKRADIRNSAQIIQSLTEDQKFSMLLPDEGAYLWRVQLLDSSGNVMIESPEGDFKIVRDLNPPNLLRPVPNEIIRFPADRILLLNWQSIEGADKYQVVLKGPNGAVISQDNEFSGLIKEISIPGGFLGGTYSVELASVKENPVIGESGISRKAIFNFVVEDVVQLDAAIPRVPGNGVEIGLQTVSTNGLLLEWEASPLLTRWAIELSLDGSATQYYPTESPRLLLTNLAPGQYRWTVHSWDKSNIEAPLSRVSRFTVKDFEYLAPPVVEFPAAGERIDMTGAKDLRFKWQAVDDNAFVELKLYSGETQTLLFQLADIKGTSYVLENLRILDVGDFVVELTAYTQPSEEEIARKSTIVRIPFSLTLNIPNTAPQILTRELLYAE